MEELTIEQMIEKYPAFKAMAEYTLFILPEEIEEIKNSEKITINNKEIPIEFLRRILEDPDYYEYAFRFFINETEHFRVACIKHNDMGESIGYYQKPYIIKGIEELIKSGKITLSEEGKKRFETLKNCSSFELFLSKYQTINYNINIDGDDYSIPFRQIMSIMELSDENFEELCSPSGPKYIYGVSKECFFYAIVKFFQEVDLFGEYVVPKNIVSRYRAIASSEKVDIEAVNRYRETTDKRYKEGKIDNRLREAILSGMPEDATELEKAIYIYIKMCKILTYDEEYYAVNQLGPVAQRHHDLSIISSVTPTNNKVVCFEFNLIYSILLNELGINFSSYYKTKYVYDDDEHAYGDGHANLTFRYDKFIISADSVTSILEGDLVKAKLNQPLDGLRCININGRTKQEFKEIVSKVYKLVASQENNLVDKVEHLESLDELLEEYSHVTKNIKEVGIKERLSILIDKVKSKKLIGIDALSYILQLRKVLFTPEQRENNISVVVIRNNQPFDETKVAMSSAIIAINDQSFKEFPEKTMYYYYNPNHELVPISREELREKFDEGIFAYIAENDPIIPGLVDNGGMKK